MSQPRHSIEHADVEVGADLLILRGVLLHMREDLVPDGLRTRHGELCPECVDLRGNQPSPLLGICKSERAQGANFALHSYCEPGWRGRETFRADSKTDNWRCFLGFLIFLVRKGLSLKYPKQLSFCAKERPKA
jgi:hypothetical protein